MRTQLLLTLSAGVMALSAGLAQAESITVINFANYMPDDIIERFKAETGIDVELVTTATNEETMGRLVASGGAGFDVLTYDQVQWLPWMRC